MKPSTVTSVCVIRPASLSSQVTALRADVYSDPYIFGIVIQYVSFVDMLYTGVLKVGLLAKSITRGQPVRH
jgi:hypothetical protein